MAVSERAGGGGLDPVYQDDAQPLRLSTFRQKLIRQEETIIFALIERAQFPRNEMVHNGSHPNAVQVEGMCLLDYMFRETEKVHAKVRRYTSPDENAFFPLEMPSPVLPMVSYPVNLKPNSININDKIKSLYLTKVLPQIAEEGSDARMHGSSAVADIACLQALSSRIHMGKFVAEAKFQAQTEEYSKLILGNDADGIMAVLTDLPVEEKVLARVEKKAGTYGQDIGGDAKLEHKVDPKVIRDLYKDIVMPLTKEVQVEYLLHRLDHDVVVCEGPDGSASHRAAIQHFGEPAKARIKLLPVGQPEKIFSALLSNHAAYGMVAFEHGRLGTQREIKKLLTESSLLINAEVFVDDGQGESTRFVVLGRSQPQPSGHDRSIICFGLPDTPGALFKALECFHQHGVNLQNLESMPSDTGDFRYDFFTEFSGSASDASVSQALKMLSERATFTRFLGSFPVTRPASLDPAKQDAERGHEFCPGDR